MSGYDRPRGRIKIHPVPDELEFLYSTRDIKALRDGYEAELDELRALADDLAEVLGELGWGHRRAEAVLARYRQAPDMTEIGHYMERLAQERALADDLYEHLDRLIPDDGVLGPSVAAVKARYRQART